VSFLDKTLTKLNESQLKAVTTSESRVLVMAGAGSGKTSVLVTRIGNLQLKERVGTSNVLALTFTRLAATEMKERVAKLLGESLARNLTAGTFHSFCVRVLKENGHKIGIDKDFSIYDTEDQQALIEGVINDLLLKSKVKKINPWNKSEDPYEMQVISEYRNRLSRNNALDLDGLLAETVRLLKEHPDVADDLRKRYLYVMVDEFQDTDSRQDKIINLLNPKNLFVVGDPSQAIYTWRGAEIENILTFEERHSNVEVIKMERNYRSTKPILDLANKVIEQSVYHSPLTLETDKDGVNVSLAMYETEKSEAKAMASRIGSIAKQSEVAILCRTNYQVEIYNRALQDAGIKTFVISNNADPLNKWDARKIFDYLSYITNQKDDRAFRKVINYPKQRITDIELRQAELDATATMKSLPEILHGYLPTITIEDRDIRTLWMQAIKELDVESHYSEQGLDNRVLDLWTARESINRWCTNQTLMGDDTDVKTFLHWLRVKDIQERMAQEKPDGVQLLTVHAAKGLEWDHVFVPGCNEDVFPSKKGDPEEERRLFYVAVTRARETLHLSYYRAKESLWQHGKMVDMEPSPYLEALK